MASYCSFTFHGIILKFIKFSLGFCVFLLQFTAIYFSLSAAAETLKKTYFSTKIKELEEDSSLVIRKTLHIVKIYARKVKYF